MPRFQSYIICTSPRSGSTLLCSLLAATGQSGHPGSYFHDPSVADWLTSFGLALLPDKTERERIEIAVNAAIKQGTGETGIFGLRLQRHSFGYFVRKLKVLHPNISSNFGQIQATFASTLFIYLTREDKLDQAISYIKATQTGLWHVAPDGTEIERKSAPNRLEYSFEKITGKMSEFRKMDAEWVNWFEREKINPLEITYKQLSKDPRGILAMILKELEANPGCAAGVDPAVAKLADQLSRQWKRRFLAEKGNNILQPNQENPRRH